MAQTFDPGTYKDVLIILGTAGVVVPVMHRLKFSPVLGYLAAGAILGPKGLGGLAGALPLLGFVTIGDAQEISGIAELGVVFLLFVVGLELSIKRLVTMRRLVFGLGGLQVLLSSILIGFTATLFGNSSEAAVLIGASLALSSTAIVLELLAQQHRLTSTVGRASFSVLLFQDLAVVPLLFLVSILGIGNDGSVTRDLIVALAQAAGTIALIVAVGWLLLRPLFRLVAGTGSHELFIATSLLVVIGTGVLSATVGLSMALGAFVAGLLLAETEYRRAIEATIDPFKGLLLGVFFISVGMKIDLVALLSDPLYIAVCALGLTVLKAALMIPLARLFGLSWAGAVEAGLLLGPGGEFAFILIGLAMTFGIITAAVGGLLLTVVALSMVTIPGLDVLGRRISARLEPPAHSHPGLLATPPQSVPSTAIIVGCGRVGRLVAAMLTAHDVRHIMTDRDPSVVVRGREEGLNVYFGDAKNALFLKHCGIAEAAAIIVTINSHPEIEDIVEVARSLRRDIVIVARARDAAHARRLYALGVTDAVPETIEASLQLSEAALVGLGVPTGLVIASIHEKRDEFRRELQSAAGSNGRLTRALRSSRSGPAD